MKKGIYLVICFLLFILQATGQRNSITLFKDGFDDNRFGWPDKKTDSVVEEVSNGKFVFINKSSAGKQSPRKLAFCETAGTTIHTSFILKEGEINKGYGLVISMKDNQNKINFLLSGNGGYMVVAYSEDKPAKRVTNGWKNTTVVKKGLGQENKLQVDIRNKLYSFYINETMVDTVTLADQPHGNYIAFVAFGKQQLLVDDFETVQWNDNKTVYGKVTKENPSVFANTNAKPWPSKDGKPRAFSFDTATKKTAKPFSQNDGLADKDGYRIIDPVLRFTGAFVEDRLFVDNGDANAYAVIDLNINLITPYVIGSSWSKAFNNGLTTVEVGEYFSRKSGLINKDGKVILPFIYDELGEPENGYIYAKLNGKSGIISLDGTPIVPFGKIGDLGTRYTNIGGTVDLKNGMVCAKADTGSLVGVMNVKGNWVISPRYEYLTFNTDGSLTFGILDKTKSYLTNYGSLKYPTLYGLLDNTGKVIVPAKYEGLMVTDNNLIVGTNDDRAYNSKKEKIPPKYGLADKKGVMLTELKYLQILSSFSDDPAFYVAYVETKENPVSHWSDAKRGLLDKNGKEVVPCIYERKKDENGISYDWSSYSNGLMNVQKDGKYGYVNSANKTVIPFDFENASGFTGGVAKVTRGGVIEYIDKAGKVVPPPLSKNVKELPPIRK